MAGFLAREARRCSATGAAGGGARRGIGGGGGFASEQPVMHPGIAGDLEMRRIARPAQHRGGVAADRSRPSGFEGMVVVENEAVRFVREAAEIAGQLSVILAAVLEVELEGADGQGMKTDHAGLPFDGG